MNVFSAILPGSGSPQHKTCEFGVVGILLYLHAHIPNTLGCSVVAVS